MTVADADNVFLDVELCGKLADAGETSVSIGIPAHGCTVSTLLSRIAQQHPGLAQQLQEERIKACINELIVTADANVMPGDVVALFPPVSGG